MLSCSLSRHSRRLLSSNLPRRRRTTTTATATQTTTRTKQQHNWSLRYIWQQVRARPVEYASIPCVAAFVGITTNWMGVKMLFYPIEYMGLDWQRWPNTPYGLFGWQGVVPTKTEPMAGRLVVIVTKRLLSLQEAFGRLDPAQLTALLLPVVQDQIAQDCGVAWSMALKPVLPFLLQHLLVQLQQEIDSCLDLHSIVLDAFVRDKVVLVDLFQKVGRVELEFLVNSGFGFGFALGLAQMGAWAAAPAAWTLPVAGALVGYVTNWIAIKLLFEPADPVNVLDLFVVQGLFESRQIEVSDEFGEFMERRVLNSAALLEDLADGGAHGDLYRFLRRHLPYPIPSHILEAAVAAIARVAARPVEHADVHAYVAKQLDISHTLSSRLKKLSPTDFEDLLHPVFQEDEITLIVTGGVLGLVAGGAQTKLGWGGPQAWMRAVMTIGVTLLSSLALYGYQKYEAEEDEPLASKERPHLQRRETILRPGPILEPIVEPVLGSYNGGDDYQ